MGELRAGSESGGGICAYLNRLWRVLMTGVCFVFFGLGGLLLSVVWFNVLLIVQPDRLKRRWMARASISWSFRFFFKAARFVRVLDYRVTGVEELLSDKGVVLVANHPTLLDYVLLASVVPQLDCIVKGDLLRNPFLRGAIKSADYLINNEEADALIKICQERLDSGGVILVFPEGTRTREHEPVKLQRGAANIALRCRKDVRLAKICCLPPVVTKESKWYQAPPIKPMLAVEAMERIKIDGFLVGDAGKSIADAIAVRRLTAYLTKHLASFKMCTFGKL